ncbi:ABC transporter permease [Streptococcus halichoeri]|uniref:ABC transporter permease n=1 Tax=Streptococcus halichoeri TaxID=254785 RepID=UPI001358942F|nr:ABC transporter permease [Streptococcus halichoeri]
MFGKLLKYEFKSIGKWYFALNAGVIAIAAILSFTIKISAASTFSGDNIFTKIIPFTLILTFGALIAGSLLATLLIIINRFNKNLFGREGYLTMTLPVSEHQLILSKFITSFVCSLFNSIVLCLAIFILIIPQVSWNSFLKQFNQLMSQVASHYDVVLGLLLYFLIGSIYAILLIYLAISIGQLFANHRGLKGIIAYAAISIATSALLSYLNTNVFHFNGHEVDYLLESNFYWITIIEQAILIGIVYFSTHFILKNKLNLQ